MNNVSPSRSRHTKQTYGGGLTQKQVNDLYSLAGNAERDDLIVALDKLKPDPSASQPTTECVLREFVADVEAVGVTTVREQFDWPDLAATYEKALAVLPQTEPATKAFKVATISENTNSFGLYSHILVAPDGEAWNACRSRGKHLSNFNKGDTLTLTVDDAGQYNWAANGFEIPERLKPDAPAAVVNEVWALKTPTSKGKFH